ncbi:MAG: hypothetical protein AMS27_09760 [Bacteroides sp. SM23_62_1]|nr:MAG: hypothetical protein AMS27_09760 [Bacteroides sp. SM23_62_1]
MGKKIVVLFLPVFLFTISCQQRVDIKKEKEAIKAVIIAETDAFDNQDYDGLVEHMVRDSTFIRMSTGKHEHTGVAGWDNMAHWYHEFATADLSDYKVEREQSNWKIKVYPECAWVVYDQITRYVYKGQKDYRTTKEIRFLEKVDGRWKINYLHVIYLSGYEKDELLEYSLIEELEEE